MVLLIFFLGGGERPGLSHLTKDTNIEFEKERKHHKYNFHCKYFFKLITKKKENQEIVKDPVLFYSDPDHCSHKNLIWILAPEKKLGPDQYAEKPPDPVSQLFHKQLAIFRRFAKWIIQIFNSKDREKKENSNSLCLKGL